jgi:ABC-type glycerol-3-phosphate transport system substrate-binding protein
MKRFTVIFSVFVIGVMILAACATPTPQIVEVTVEVEKEVKVTEIVKEEVEVTKVVKEEVEVTTVVEVEKEFVPLFWDEAAGKCAKTVKLTIATHGDHQSRNQDALFGCGVLQNQWEQLQPCVEVETQRVPQGTSPNIAVERWTAGTHADVVFTWVGAQQAGTENKWVLPLEEYFDDKNPYSPNATWYEDFLFPEIFYTPHTDGHTYWVRPGVRPGSNGLVSMFYNRDLLLAAGVSEDKIIPKTWTEWFDNLQKIKDYGKTPIFIPLAGNTNWEWSAWYVWWTGDYFSGNLAEDMYAVMEDGTENPQGTISQQKQVRSVIEGVWTLEDPRAFEFFNVSARLFDMLQPGYAAVPELVAETPTDFLKGNIGYCFAGVWRVSTVSRYPGLPFTWGTVWLPKPDTTFSQYATDHYSMDTGQSPATAEMVHLAISSTAARDPDILAAAVDFAMYMTAPTSNQTWCTYQSVPCTEPGTSFDEIVGDNEELRMQLYGFFNPPRDGKYVGRGPMNPIQWLPGGTTELNRRFTEYYEGKMTKEAFIKSMMNDIMLNAKDQCKHALDVGIPGWEFCSELDLN